MAGFFDGAGAGLIGGVGSLLGSIFGGFSQAANNRAMMHHQTAMWESQKAHDIDMLERNKDVTRYFRDYDYDLWLKQNDYNSPESQKQRLLEAGINPYLNNSAVNSGQSSPSYGGSPSGGASSYPGMPNLPAPNYLGGLDVAFRNIASTISQLGVNDVNNVNTNADTGLKLQLHGYNEKMNPLQLQLAGSQLKINESTEMQIREQTSLYQAQRVGQSLSNEEHRIMLKYLDQQQQADLLFNVQRSVQQLYDIAESQSRINVNNKSVEKMQQDILESGSRVILNSAMEQFYLAGARKNSAEAKQLKDTLKHIVKKCEFEASMAEIQRDNAEFDLFRKENQEYNYGWRPRYATPESAIGGSIHKTTDFFGGIIGNILGPLSPLLMKGKGK